MCATWFLWQSCVAETRDEQQGLLGEDDGMSCTLEWSAEVELPEE